jgi:hypothetical protein
LEREAGDGRTAIEVFDWIVLDRFEQFQQSFEKTEFVIEAARQAGYEEVENSDGLILFRRPEG